MKKKNNKKFGQDVEEQVRKTINSGAIKLDPLDLSSGKYCIEIKGVRKESKSQSFRITKELLEKMWNQSLDVNKEPIIIINIPANDYEDYMIVGHVIKQTRRHT